MIRLVVNGTQMQFDGDPNMPLLWYLREDLKLKGSKFGCGIGQCGACTVHANGAALRSCTVPMSVMDGADIKTIEGLATDDKLHPVQEAWIAEDAPQCGYCQAGQIMATADLLQRIPEPSDKDIDDNITNLCRCGSYYRIRRAIHRAARAMQEPDG